MDFVKLTIERDIRDKQVFTSVTVTVVPMLMVLYNWVLYLFKYPDLKKMHEIKAHDNEVDDLDFTPDGKQVSA